MKHGPLCTRRQGSEGRQGWDEGRCSVDESSMNIYIKKALNVSFLSNHFSWTGRLHSSHMPQGCTRCSHFEAHLPIFACSTFCNNEETGSKCLLHSSHIQQNFTGGRTCWKEREEVVIERANIEWLLFSSRTWKELVSNHWAAVGNTRWWTINYFCTRICGLEIAREICVVLKLKEQKFKHSVGSIREWGCPKVIFAKWPML